MSYKIGGINIAPIAYGSIDGTTLISNTHYNCTLSGTAPEYIITPTIYTPSTSILTIIATLGPYSGSFANLTPTICINYANTTSVSVTPRRLRSSNDSSSDSLNFPFSFVIFSTS
jgi:hypothetical protein